MLKKRFATIASLLVLCGLLTACNTISGAGEDIEAGGRGISNAADRVSPY